MIFNVITEVSRLRKMTMIELRARFTEVFGEATNANNRDWLVKRIVWRLQANAEGGISERAKRRAEELANDADLRLNPPRPKQVQTDSATSYTGNLTSAQSERLPPPGSILTRTYKGETVQVKVLESGFEHNCTRYKSLSAVAKAISGQHCNGYAFFHLNAEVSR